MSDLLASQVAVTAVSSEHLSQAQGIAESLSLQLLPPGSDPKRISQYPLVLLCSDQGVGLQQTGPKAPGPVMVDFVSGAVAHRRKFGGGAGQQIAKAVGIKSGVRPRIADVTAGLGRDAFVLATLGCEVTLVERSPVVALLLDDGISRGRVDLEVADILARMQLHGGDAIDWLRRFSDTDPDRPEVVYLDPMFPHSKKTALVKKEMKLFRQLIGDDSDTADLLKQALITATHRVVVKRPRLAPVIEGPAPSFVLEGKSGRFDIYALKRF